MKNKKGFSLVELLIVIAIVGVLAGIIVPSVNKYLKNSRIKYNEKLSTELVSFAKSYHAENKEKLLIGHLDNQGVPINKALLGAAYLLNNNYITGKFVDSEGNDCSNRSYVIVEKEDNDYRYTPCIVCDNGYTSDKTKCIYEPPKTDGTMKDNIAPRCELTLKQGKLNTWINTDVVLNFEAVDNEALAGYSLNGSDMVAISGAKYSRDITFNETGQIDSYFAIVDDKTASSRTCYLDGSIKIDKVVPSVNINATKKNSGVSVASESLSYEGLNFTLTAETTGPSGYTIYYCKDTTNTCSPTIETKSGSLIKNYNELTEKYYIRYKIVSGAGLSSSVGSYQANVKKDALPSKVVLYNYAYNNSYVYNSEVGQKIVVYIPELTDISHLTITRTFYEETIPISPNSFTYQSSCDSVSGITSNCFKYTDEISGYAVKGYYAEYKVCNSSNTCKSNSTLISLRGCLQITNKTGKNCWDNKGDMCDATKGDCTGNKLYSSSYNRFFIGQFTEGSAVFNRTTGFRCYMWDGSIEQVKDYRCDLHPEGTGQSAYGKDDY